MPEDKKTETTKKGRADGSAQLDAAKQSVPEDDVVGKAYDSQLMGRLVRYLRPYKMQTALSAAAILFKAASDVIGPYLVKVAVDAYLMRPAPGEEVRLSWLARHLSRDPATGISEIGMLYLGALVLTFLLEFLQTYLMQWTGQKIMFDMRSEIFRHLQRDEPWVL